MMYPTDEITSDNEIVDAENDKKGTEIDWKRTRSSNYVPKDRENRCCIFFFVLGISTYIPWFFFMNSIDYWTYKFRDITAEGTNKMAGQVLSQLNLASAIPYSLFFVLNIFLCKRISTRVRAVGTQITIIIIFMLTTLFIHWNTDNIQFQFLLITLTSAAALNALGSTFTGTLFSIVGHFPSKYISAMSLGQACSGILAAICQIISLYFATNPISTANMYFIIGDVVIILAYFAYLSLERQEFFKYHMKEKEIQVLNNHRQFNENPVKIPYMKILKKIFPYGLSMFLVFFVTYSVYPPVNGQVKSQASQDSEWYKKYFTPVATYLLFSIGEGLGCLLSRYSFLLDGKPRLSVTLAALRILFIPIFLICNAEGRIYWETYITSDVAYMILMIVFSTNHGYMWSTLFVVVPKIVDDGEQEVASAMMGAFLGIGYSLGALMSYLCISVLFVTTA